MFICMYARERPEGTEVSAEIQKLASEFSNKIPERVFSPAQLQGYLLGYSTSPQLAVYEIQKWVENETAMAKAKKEKEKAAKAKKFPLLPLRLSVIYILKKRWKQDATNC